MAEEIKETISTADVAPVGSKPTEPVGTTAPEPVQKVEEKPIKTYEEEYKSLKKEKEELTQKLYQTQMHGYVKTLGLVDDIHEKYLAEELKKAGATFEDGNIKNADKVVKTFKEKYPQAFKPSINEVVSLPTSKNIPKAMSGVEQAFARRNPNLKF